MSVLRRLTGFLLLAVWLVATQHCGLEAADLIQTGSDDGSAPLCCTSSGPCTHDGCTLVERGSFPSSSSTVKVTAPVLHEGLCILCAHLLVPVMLSEPLPGFTQGDLEPLGWVPTWHFERRAAQSPRAPSVIQA